MARFLTTIPSNTGFVNLGLVETYPTGGGGPTAYGPTSYFGSDPRPAEDGDNLNNPIDLGDFSEWSSVSHWQWKNRKKPPLEYLIKD